MTCVRRSFHLFRGIGTNHTRKLNFGHYSTFIQVDPAIPLRLPTAYETHMAYKSTQEKKNGITEILGPTPQLLGGIKEECGHFQVHEIDPDGNRVQLTDLTPLPPANFDDPDKQFIHCTMYKEGFETTEALRLLFHGLTYEYNHSKLNRYNKKEFNKISYAGRKDKKAQTTQRICIRNVPEIFTILPKLGKENIKLGNFDYAPRHFQIGHLKGNHFTILLNNLEFEQSNEIPFNFDSCKSALDESMQNFCDNGFINYFGLQRFGINSAKIGAAVLTLNWENVFDLILIPWLSEEDYLTKIKYAWLSSRDPEEMVKLIPPDRQKSTSAEVKLVLGLAKHYQKGQGPLVKAYLEIPWTSRSIHLSSFISSIWNHVASYRIKQFGLEVIPGDYVYAGTFRHKNNVKMLTQEDVQSGQYSIYDVLLPILGYSIPRYSHPSLQEFCTEFLAQHELGPDCFENFTLDSVRTDIQAGFYRSLLVKPENVTHKIIPSNELINLKQHMPSDLDLLEANEVNEGQGSTISMENVGNDCEENKYCAILDFSLPKSSYATMAFREIIK